MKPYVGMIIKYRDTDHEGFSYSPYESLSGIYKVVDTSGYPECVSVQLIEGVNGTGKIFYWDEQVEQGMIEAR